MSNQWRQARDDHSSAGNQKRRIPNQWSGWSGKSWNTDVERTGHTWTLPLVPEQKLFQTLVHAMWPTYALL
jgi:hypothetical protein